MMSPTVEKENGSASRFKKIGGLGILIVLILFFFIFIYFLIECALYDSPSKIHRHRDRLSPRDTVSADEMQKDFLYVVKRLQRVHPQTVNGFSDEKIMLIQETREKWRAVVIYHAPHGNSLSHIAQAFLSSRCTI